MKVLRKEKFLDSLRLNARKYDKQRERRSFKI